MMSKKLFFGIFAVLIVFFTAVIVKDSVIADSAIRNIGTISLIYLGGQAGVDTMGKFKSQ